MATRSPITCHVLDTTTGRPAANVPVTLTLLRPFGPSTALSATTNADGRVTSWSAAAGGPSLEDIFAFVSGAASHHAAAAADGEAVPLPTPTISAAPPAPATSLVRDSNGVGGGIMPVAAFGEVKDAGAGADGSMVWALRFDAGSYFKGEGFWTEIEIRFKTVVGRDGGEAATTHWHVPLLLSPWSYTTYRGS